MTGAEFMLFGVLWLLGSFVISQVAGASMLLKWRGDNLSALAVGTMVSTGVYAVCILSGVSLMWWLL